MATLLSLKGWFQNLSTPQKVALGGSLSLIAFLIHQKRKKQQIKKDADDEIESDNQPQAGSSSPSSSEILLPISLKRPFWCSYLLTACTFGLTFSSNFNAFVNKHIPRVMSHRLRKLFSDFLPPVPQTLSQSFALGQLQQQLSTAASKEQIHEILLSATKLLNRSLDKMVTSEQLNDVLNQILLIENKKSMLSKIRGFFSFVNVIWFFSILGISTTVLPFIYLIGKPIWVEIYNFLRNGYFQISKRLKALLINPIAFNVYEVFGYFVCWYFMYLGYEGKTNIGFWVSFTGLALWIPMQLVSFGLHPPLSGNRHQQEAVGMSMLSLLSGLMSLPMAYYYNSKLLGFATVAGLYSYLGFFIHGFFGGYIVGFQGDVGVRNCVSASVIFNAMIIGSKLKNIDLYPMRMFISPTLIVSNSILFLALLCHSSEWRYHRKETSYWQRQALMIGSLATAMAMGNVLSYPALANTAYVYSGLYIMQKMAECRPLWHGERMIFTIFGSSVLGWRIALYLNQNPQIVTGMFQLE